MPIPNLPELADRRMHLFRAQGTKNRSWYRIENKTAEDVADVYIYDEIGYWGTTAAQFVKDFQSVTAKSINLHINSPGGDMWDGIAIYTAIQAHPATVTTHVDSLAASAASIIAMAGERIVMAKHSTLMIHDPYTITLGNAAELRQMADVLDKAGENLAGIYAERAGGTVGEWRQRMLEETWYSDREAVDAGLADEVAGDEAETKAAFDLSIFHNVPESLCASVSRTRTDTPEPPTKRDLERILRDAGCTRAQAKAMAAAYGESDDDGARDASELAEFIDGLKQLTEVFKCPS